MLETNGTITKILLVLAFGILTLVSAMLEGYADYIQGYVIVFFAVVLIICVISAFVISFRFLLSLVLFGFSFGFITQSIGVTSDLWCYEHTFIFAAFSWSLATVTMVEISRRIRLKLKEVDDKSLNVITILLIFAVIPITLHLQKQLEYAKYRPVPKEWVKSRNHNKNQNPNTEQIECFFIEELPDRDRDFVEFALTYDKYEPNVPFWLYYIALTVFALVTSYHLSFTELISMILAAWIMGGASEFIGATAKLWHFRTETLPPLFLVLGCWPLEFLVIRNLACRVLLKRDDQDILESES